jgi:hypothetical protein
MTSLGSIVIAVSTDVLNDTARGRAPSSSESFANLFRRSGTSFLLSWGADKFPSLNEAASKC